MFHMAHHTTLHYALFSKHFQPFSHNQMTTDAMYTEHCMLYVVHRTLYVYNNITIAFFKNLLCCWTISLTHQWVKKFNFNSEQHLLISALLPELNTNSYICSVCIFCLSMLRVTVREWVHITLNPPSSYSGSSQSGFLSHFLGLKTLCLQAVSFPNSPNPRVFPLVFDLSFKLCIHWPFP